MLKEFSFPSFFQLHFLNEYFQKRSYFNLKKKNHDKVFTVLLNTITNLILEVARVVLVNTIHFRCSKMVFWQSCHLILVCMCERSAETEYVSDRLSPPCSPNWNIRETPRSSPSLPFWGDLCAWRPWRSENQLTLLLDEACTQGDQTQLASWARYRPGYHILWCHYCAASKERARADDACFEALRDVTRLTVDSTLPATLQASLSGTFLQTQRPPKGLGTDMAAEGT